MVSLPIKKIMRFFILITSIFFTLNCFSQGSGSSLSFDGTNDRVNIANNVLSTPTALSVEMWVNTSSAAGNDALTFSIEGAYFIRIYSTGNVQAVFDGSTSANNPELAVGINDGNWHHLAATCDGTTTTVYVDGVNVGSQSESFFDINALNRASAVGAQYNGGSNFSGQIDEFRIWTSVRTQAEIRANMCKKLTGSENNLFLYYRFDEASGTTATDNAGSNDGTLTNMDDTDWTTSGAPIGDESTNSYSVTTSTSLNIASAAGDDLTANITALTVAPSSVHLYRVDEEPNVTTPPGTQTQLSQNTYYGVAVFDGSGVAYTAIMNYDGHGGIIDENDLELAKRDNNAGATWSQEDATLDTEANTLTLAGQTGTEYILASIGVDPLPIELLSFDASAKENNTVLLEWQTASELDNDFFTIERSTNGLDWQEINKVDGAGNSSSPISYSATDDNPYNGVQYYRLKQTDFDGQFRYFDMRSVSVEKSLNLQIEIYPNPVTNKVILEGNSNELEKIVFYNTLAQNVSSLVNLVKINETQFVADMSKLNTGMYYVKTKTTNNKVYKQ